MPQLTDLDRTHEVGQPQASVLQNQVTALFGVISSTSWVANFKTLSTSCQHVETVASLLQIYSQSFQNNMPNGSLPRQSRTKCTQAIFGLIGLAGGLHWVRFTFRPVCTGVCTSATRTTLCCTDGVTSFVGSSTMVLGGTSLTVKTRLIIIGDNINAEILRWNSETSSNPISQHSGSKLYLPQWQNLPPQSWVHQWLLLKF